MHDHASGALHDWLDDEGDEFVVVGLKQDFNFAKEEIGGFIRIWTGDVISPIGAAPSPRPLPEGEGASATWIGEGPRMTSNRSGLNRAWEAGDAADAGAAERVAVIGFARAMNLLFCGCGDSHCRQY